MYFQVTKNRSTNELHCIHAQPYNTDGELNVKGIGVFDCDASVAEGVQSAKSLPGFKDNPANFVTTRFQLNKTHWESGFTERTFFPENLGGGAIDPDALPIQALALEKVYCLTHFFEDADLHEEVRYIGIYASQDMADAVIGLLCKKPGFEDRPDDFNIDCCKLNKHEWTEGFVGRGDMSL